MSSLQDERSAETRRRLLDATVECLHEFGYSGTTTTEIARRARVSRGAQMHHFQRKQKLVVSALEYVFDLRIEGLRLAMAELPSAPSDRIRALVKLMWDAFKGPTFYAWLELVVASRTDPELRAAVGAASQRFGVGVREVFGELFPQAENANDVENRVEFVLFGMLEALALERVLCISEDDERRRIEPALAYVEVLARFAARTAAMAETAVKEGATS